MKISTKKIAYIALLTAVNTILNTFDFSVAGGSFKISLTYIATFLAGFYFGPCVGFLVGVLGDVLGCLIWPKGPWLPLMTLGSGLMGLIPGLVRMIKGDDRLLLVISYLIVCVVCTLGLNTYTLWKTYSSIPFLEYLIIKRIPTQLPVLFINMILNLIALPYFNRLILPRLKDLKVAS